MWVVVDCSTSHVFLLIYNFETIDMVFLSMWFTDVILLRVETVSFFYNCKIPSPPGHFLIIFPLILSIIRRVHFGFFYKQILC